RSPLLCGRPRAWSAEMRQPGHRAAANPFSPRVSSFATRTWKGIMRRVVVGCVLLLGVSLVVFNVGAGTLYWSGDGINQGGTGTWNTSLQRWSTNATGGPFTNVWNNANTDSAVFDTAVGGVSVAAGVTVNSMTTTLGGFTFSNSSQITFSGTAAGLNANHASG